MFTSLDHLRTSYSNSFNDSQAIISLGVRAPSLAYQANKVPLLGGISLRTSVSISTSLTKNGFALQRGVLQLGTVRLGLSN